MDLTLIPIGYGNVVVGQRIVAIISPDSSPVKRLREEALHSGKLVDATHGRRTRAIIVTDSDHVILSALQPETISLRFTDEPPAEPTGEIRARKKK
jgi:extracellular matrix regulatory protein A